MFRSTVRRIRSNAVALLALFVALGGTATAAGVVPGVNTVGSKQVKNGSLRTADLHRTARTGTISKARMAQVVEPIVEEQLSTPQVLAALSTAVEGDAGPTGPQGPTGATVQGPAGPQGAQGVKGDRGERGEVGGVWGKGRVAADGSTGQLSGVAVTHPSTGVYCLQPVRDTLAAIASPEGDGASDRTAVVHRAPTSGPCAGSDWQVTLGTAAGTVVDHAFYVIVD